jgi:hypothetical protein
MKKSAYLILALALVSLNTNAQDLSPKTNEIGFNLNGTQFGVRYKTGNGSTLLRLTLLSLYSNTNWNDSQSGKSTNNQQGIGFNIGFEKKKSIAENINFYLGSDLLTSFEAYGTKYKSSGDEYKNATLSAGIGFVIGLNFNVTNRISISTEIVPSIIYSHTLSKSSTQVGDSKSTSDGINYGLSTRGINITLCFSLNKKN